MSILGDADEPQHEVEEAHTFSVVERLWIFPTPIEKESQFGIAVE